MRFFQKKHRISHEELAQKLAVAFSHEIKHEFSDPSNLQWMWEALPQADVMAVAREWAVVHLFLRSMAFRSHSRNREATELTLDFFHSYAFDELTQQGFFHTDSDISGFLQQRYERYYEAASRSNDLSFQIMRIAETFFRFCGGLNAVALGAATLHFTHVLAAEKKLIGDLERDVIIE